MAKEKETSLEAQRKQEAKEAKKKLKEAEKSKASASSKSEKKSGDKAPKKKRFRKFWKDFRGELKKIIWPDFKTVMKNTGIVLITVIVIGAMVWVLDFLLSSGVTGLKNLAQGVAAAQTEPDFSDELTTLLEDETEAGTTQAEESTADNAAE